MHKCSFEILLFGKRTYPDISSKFVDFVFNVRIETSTVDAREERHDFGREGLPNVNCHSLQRNMQF